jgi:hypothetical protein
MTKVYRDKPITHKKIGDFKKIDGHLYKLDVGYHFKSAADEDANSIRKKLGHNARVTKSANGYLVWKSIVKRKNK